MPAAATMIDSGVRMSTEVDRVEWDAFVNAHPDGTHCHLWNWRTVIERVFGHGCEYLAARRGGRLTGVLPLVKFKSRLFGRSVISLPFLNNGGLLTLDDESAAVLVDGAREIASAFGAKHIELRHRRRLLPSLPSRDHKVGMLMPLLDADKMWSGLDRKVRNQVRKAQKSELEVVKGGAELVEDFYAVFADNMRDLGTPVYSKRFFQDTAGAFADSTRLFVVRHQQQPIAAAFTCTHQGIVEVPWASSLKAFRNLCANMLMYWSMIESASQDGHRVFDFGRSTPDAGTYHFKLQWGAVPQPLHWEYVLLKSSSVPDHGPTNPKFHAVIEAWKRLPLWVTTAIGPSIVRNIP